jgi:hypothetical protein
VVGWLVVLASDEVDHVVTRIGISLRAHSRFELAPCSTLRRVSGRLSGAAVSPWSIRPASGATGYGRRESMAGGPRRRSVITAMQPGGSAGDGRSESVPRRALL